MPTAPLATPTIDRILCPVDFSEFSRHALELATNLAVRWSAELVVLHVYVPPIVPIEVATLPLPQLEDQLLEDLEVLLQAVRARGVRAYALLRVGAPALEIVNLAMTVRADLVVMGTHGRTGFDRWLLGSTAERVLRKAPCPVLTVCQAQHDAAADGAAPFSNVLCALDLTARSGQTLRHAAALAAEAGGRLTVLHALEGQWNDLSETLGHLDVPEYRRLAESDARARLHSVVQAAVPADGDVVERVETGKAYRQILALASGLHPDLIVVGAHGANALDTLFGSTAQHVVRGAPCPVLAVR